MKKATELIAQHLLEVHEGNNWTDMNLTDVLKDITAQEAATVTPASANTIEALLNHITYWNRVMVQRIIGVKVEVPLSNGFDTKLPLTNADWQHAIAENMVSAYELAEAIKTVDGTKLEKPIIADYSSTYKNLQGTVEHVHYHLGQIVMLKNLVRALS